ncbi:MAG: acyl-CoA dehydrogenase family protein [Dehalococcoidia bacterium]|nr:acyl-CoA dehydrogenase family protein [Dehalococcoidia bacterium]
MISFELTDEQKMVRDMVRDFSAKEIQPHIEELDEKGEYDKALPGKMAALGLLGGPIPEKYGGSALDYISFGLTCDELEYVDTSARTIVSVHVGLIALTLLSWGSEEQRQRFVRPLASGEKIGCFGLTEPGSGSDVAGMQSTAARKDGAYVLNGEKMWISLADLADIALYFAYTDKEKKGRGISAFIVERGMSGFTSASIHGKMGVRAGNTGSLAVMDCKIAAENRLGEEGEGFTIAMFALDQGRYGVASGAAGAIRACLDLSVKYANERMAFGQRIGEFQLIKHMIANMSVNAEIARLLYLKAGDLKNQGITCTKEVSMAKWFNTQAAEQSARDAIQVHGSYGYSNEYPVERIYRNVRGGTILEGTNEVHTMIQSDFALGYRSQKPGRCTLPAWQGT